MNKFLFKILIDLVDQFNFIIIIDICNINNLIIQSIL